MNEIIVWKNGTLEVKYLNNKYSFYNDGRLIINNYDSITPCDNSFFIGCIKDDGIYKYQLFGIDGEKIFGDDKSFELIHFNSNTQKFTLYNYFNKIEIIMPNLSQDKYRLFCLFLKQIYKKETIETEELQKIIDGISKKVEELSPEHLNEIIENIELANKLYIKLNKPSYLESYLIVLDEETKANLLNAIINHADDIFEVLTKDIIKNPKIKELNKDIINNIVSLNSGINLNQVLNELDIVSNKIEDQMKYNELFRSQIFKSLESIKEYFLSKEKIKYFDENDFNYIKCNKNLFLNIVYNKCNQDILNLLNKYDIS